MFSMITLLLVCRHRHFHFRAKTEFLSFNTDMFLRPVHVYFSLKIHPSYIFASWLHFHVAKIWNKKIKMLGQRFILSQITILYHRGLTYSSNVVAKIIFWINIYFIQFQFSFIKAMILNLYLINNFFLKLFYYIDHN